MRCSSIMTAILFFGIISGIFAQDTTPISPPSGSSHWLFQGHPAEIKFLAAPLGISGSGTAGISATSSFFSAGASWTRMAFGTAQEKSASTGASRARVGSVDFTVSIVLGRREQSGLHRAAQGRTRREEFTAKPLEMQSRVGNSQGLTPLPVDSRWRGRSG